MRIAHFSWESLYSIKVGGLAYVVTKLAEYQAKLGNEVHVFTRMGSNQEEYEFINGVHYHRCAFSFETDFFNEIIQKFNPSLINAFEKAEKKFGNFDIVHAHDWHVTLALEHAKNKGRKTVYTFHTTEYGRCGNCNGFGVSESIRNLEWYASYIADIVTVISNVLKDEVKFLYKLPDWKLRVIYNALDYQNFDKINIDPWHDVKKHLGFGVYDPVFLFIGRLVWQKGIDMLIEAFPLVVKEFPNARLVIIGEGEMKNDMIKRAAELNLLNKNIFFLGYVDEETKIKWLKACDALVVPSRNEPFGLVVLEAWAAYKPVIAPHATGAGEIVWHDVTGLKVFQEPASIAWGIKEIIKNPEKARWMGKNGRYAVEVKFNWNNIAKEYLSVYQELLK